MREQRLDYWKDMWNLIDTSQFIIFTILYFIKMVSQFQTDSFAEIILSTILLMQSFYKVFYFIRLYEPCAFIILMAVQIIKDVFAFAIFIVVFVLIFCKQYTVMHMGINDPTG